MLNNSALAPPSSSQAYRLRRGREAYLHPCPRLSNTSADWRLPGARSAGVRTAFCTSRGNAPADIHRLSAINRVKHQRRLGRRHIRPVIGYARGGCRRPHLSVHQCQRAAYMWRRAAAVGQGILLGVSELWRKLRCAMLPLCCAAMHHMCAQHVCPNARAAGGSQGSWATRTASTSGCQCLSPAAMNSPLSLRATATRVASPWRTRHYAGASGLQLGRRRALISQWRLKAATRLWRWQLDKSTPAALTTLQTCTAGASECIALAHCCCCC